MRMFLVALLIMLLSDFARCCLVSRSWYRAAKGKGCYWLEFAEVKTVVKRVAGLGLQKIIGYDLTSCSRKLGIYQVF
jgi:hypothetical protein